MTSIPYATRPHCSRRIQAPGGLLRAHNIRPQREGWSPACPGSGAKAEPGEAPERSEGSNP